MNIKKYSQVSNINLEKIYFFIIISFLFITWFLSIPTDKSTIGISSDLLDIGDRYFYLNKTPFQGNYLYPTILNLLTKLSSFFGQTNNSRLWNFLVISITSILSISTLKLIKETALNLYDRKISQTAVLIYILNPYTYFFALNGGLTFYVLWGVTLTFNIFSRIPKNFFLDLNINFLKNIFLISILCLYLSSLRPNASIYSLILLSYIFINIIIKQKNFYNSRKILFCSFLILTFSFIFSINSLIKTQSYISQTILIFQNENGYFFGYSRDLLRNKISSLNSINLLSSIRSHIYLFVWKITDFLSGFSDIRDTHDAFNENKSLFPFLARIFTGIFYLIPFNTLTILSLIKYFKYLLKTNTWIIFFAAIISISPSFIGVAMSRYWIMFYSPFLVLVAKLLNDIFKSEE